jgi:hypothetical protein
MVQAEPARKEAVAVRVVQAPSPAPPPIASESAFTRAKMIRRASGQFGSAVRAYQGLALSPLIGAEIGR